MNKFLLSMLITLGINLIVATDLNGSISLGVRGTEPGIKGPDWDLSTYASFELTTIFNNDLEFSIDSTTNIGLQDASSLFFQLDRLYFKWFQGDIAEVSVGMIPINWGQGHFFNAVDISSPNNTITNNQKAGLITGSELVFFTNELTALTIVTCLGNKLSQTNGAMRFDALVGETDIALGISSILLQDLNNTTDAATVLGSLEYSYILFADFIHYFDSFGLYGELSYIPLNRNVISLWDGSGYKKMELENKTHLLNFTVGCSWDNGDLISLRMEYHHNGEGLSASEANIFLSSIASNSTHPAIYNPALLNPGRLQKHYLGLSASTTIQSNYTFDIKCLYNILEFSGAYDLGFSCDGPVPDSSFQLSYSNYFQLPAMTSDILEFNSNMSIKIMLGFNF